MNRSHYSRYRRRRRVVKSRFFVIIGLLAALTACIFLLIKTFGSAGDSKPNGDTIPVTTSAINLPENTPQASDKPMPTPEPPLPAGTKPAATVNTEPGKFGFVTSIYVDGVQTDTYTRSGSVNFGTAAQYTGLLGVTTYRGNNYRNEASWGTATISQGKLTLMDIDKTTGTIGSWGGSACTGQPLIVTWPDKTRQNMKTLYDEFRTKTGFTEVIIASVDGNIYFMELSTGKKTRDPIKIGSPTKGTPSLDPRGYPVIYVGQGLNPQGSTTECDDMYTRIYSLINGEMLYKFGAPKKDPVAYRSWQAYDASPLIDAATDTLIMPGENGVLYTVKLNTAYNEDAGTVSMAPDPIVKYAYTSTRNKSAYGGKGIYGMENSPVGWRNYLFFTDNIGMLQCVDLNTMQLVYANDLDNDSDVSMVLEEDGSNNKLFLYTGCEYDDTVVNATSTSGTCYARKLDALTGEILWSTPFNVYTAINGSVDGGILASPILGKKGTTLEGLIIYTVSSYIKTDGSRTALVVALDKNTGDIVWQVDMENSGWTPSSPVPVYTEDGQGYIVQCLYKGTIKLIRADKNSASVSDSINVSAAKGTDEPNSFEATPVVFGNTIVVGSRSAHFFYLTIN